MRITDKLKNLFKESGKGKIGEVRGLYKYFTKTREEKASLEKYEKIYRQVPIVQAAINYTADLAVGTGYHLVSENETELKKVEEFLADNDFALLMHRVTRHLLIYGNAYMELVSLGDNLIELKLLHPKTMRVLTSENGTGEVIGYEQIVGPGPEDVETFGVDEIAHFKWNVVGDDLVGTSVIAPVINILNSKLMMEMDLGLISHRYAAPQVHYKIGSEEDPATPDQISAFESELEEHNPEMDLVTDHNIEVKEINPLKGKIGVEEFLVHVENQVIAGLQVPEIALGRGQNITEATAKVQVGIFDRRIKSIQRVLVNQSEDLIISRISKAVKIEFGEFEKEDEDIKVNRLLRLKAAGIVSREYVAEKLGIETKYIPEEDPGNTGDMALKGLDDNKKDVSPRKEPVESLEDGFYYIRVQNGEVKVI